MANKLQRWIDLLAALLSRSLPATFLDLSADVPEYAATLREIRTLPTDAEQKTGLGSLMRSFERDKAELREFGVPIDTVLNAETNDPSVYRLERKAFYLPYLSMCASPRP